MILKRGAARIILPNYRNYHSRQNNIGRQIINIPNKELFLIGYVYVGKDIEDSRSLYKFGSTIDLKRRLAYYKTGQPNFEFVIRVKTPDYLNLEKKLISKYKPFLYKSEIFKNIDLSDVKKQLKKWGYHQNTDQIFIKN